jgi:hypothetical protein
MKTVAQENTTLVGASPIERHVQALDWRRIACDLDTQGNAILAQLIKAR